MTSISFNAARRHRSEPTTSDAGAVLAIVLACYLMIILDASVVITALP
jgi:hypothetical protein